MKVTGFNEAVAEAVSRDPRFHPEGYLFLRDCLEGILSKRAKRKRPETTPPVSRHITAGELLEGFRGMALGEFGPMTLTVLEHWGIRNCRNIGTMVFLLVEAGAFARTEEDLPEAFEPGFDFHEAFVAPFLPPEASHHGDRPFPDEKTLSMTA